MTAHNSGEITWYSWPLLDRMGVKAGTATGMNTALHAPAGVDKLEIRRNRVRLSHELCVNPAKWICADQVHGSSSVILDRSHGGRGSLSADDAIPATDALILGESSLQAMIFTADCLPVILYDRERKIAALIHAGWRGAASGIVPRVLKKMISDLNCRKDHILAAAGPAIDACCYQVDRPVFEGLTRHYPETEDAFSPDGKDHWRLSLEQAVFLQLRERGLRKEQMEGSGLCSCCTESLFSWRRQGPESGRMATFCCL